MTITRTTLFVLNAHCADCDRELDSNSIGINGGALCPACYDQRTIDIETYDSQPTPTR